MAKRCENCKFSNWSVGIGMGHFCVNPKNKNRDFSDKTVKYPNTYPQVSREFVCEFHEYKDF